MIPSDQLNREHFNRRTLLAGTGVSALALLIAACGGDDKGMAGNTPGGSGSLKEIDLLTVALPSSLSNLYPGQEAGNFNYYVACLVGEGLVAPDGTGKLVPALASKWEQTSPTTYVYTLRDGAKFSDGTLLTPEDVVYSVGISKDEEKSPNIAYYWANVDKAEKTGDNEVTITLASLMSHSNGVLVPPMLCGSPRRLTSKVTAAKWEHPRPCYTARALIRSPSLSLTPWLNLSAPTLGGVEFHQ